MTTKARRDANVPSWERMFLGHRMGRIVFRDWTSLPGQICFLSHVAKGKGRLAVPVKVSQGVLRATTELASTLKAEFSPDLQRKLSACEPSGSGTQLWGEHLGAVVSLRKFRSTLLIGFFQHGSSIRSGIF